MIFPTSTMVNDRNGGITFAQAGGLGPDFDPTPMFKWVSAAIIIGSVLSVISIIIFCFVKLVVIIKCLKMVANGEFPSYKQITSTYTKLASGDSDDHEAPSSEHVVVSIPPVFPVMSYSQLKGETMEMFLEEIAREKPIRFSSQQIQELIGDSPTNLGSGGFGVVFKGMFPNGVLVAVKMLKNHSDKIVQEQFMAEVSTMGRTYHVNLVRLYGFCFDTTMRALVYEYMENGSLDKVLFGQNQGIIGWEKLHQIAIGTAKGIAYLHEECQQRIIHYDIKPGNVLLDANLNPKVADFGLAKLCNTKSSYVFMTGCKGTPGYAAPELWKPYPVTHKCDVYSFGKLLFEIVARRRNHDPNTSEGQEWLPMWTWEMFKKGELSDLLSQRGIEEKDTEKAERMLMVALWCVQHLPESRPNMSDVVKMLEGGMEIIPPSYPFEHSELTIQSSTASESSSMVPRSVYYSVAPTRANNLSLPPCSKHIEGSQEIELAS